MATEDERIKLLKVIKQLQKEIVELEEQRLAISKKDVETDKKLGQMKAELVARARELRKANMEIRDMAKEYLTHQKEQEARISSISDSQFFIKDIEKKRLANYNGIDTKISKNLETFNAMADVNIEIASLSSDQTAELGLLQIKYLELQESLDYRGAGLKDQLEILDEQNQKATAYAGMSERNKEILEGQRQVLTGINKSIQGVVETAKTLVSGPMGMLGTALIGAGFAMDKIGHVAHQTGTFFSEMTLSAAGLGMVFEDATGVATGLASELGSIEEATFGAQLRTNLLANNLHLSSQEATSLIGAFSRLNDGSTDVATDMITATKNLAKQNNVIPSQVMQDLAGSTEAFALYAKDGGDNIAMAAVQAAKLGVNMSAMTNVTESLLDFESSMVKELELSALLGRNINLNKARQLAYEGEIGSAVKESLKQLGGVEAYNKMDVFQKKEAASLLGLSAAEMDKMVKNQDKLNADGSVQLSQSEQVFSYLSETVKMIGTGPFGGMLKALGGGAVALGQMGFDMKGMIGSTAKVAKNLLMWPVNKIGGLFGKGVGGATKSIAGKATETVKNKIPTGAGKGMGSVTSTIEKINPGKLLAGAAAMAIAAGAVFIFAKATQEFMKVSWEAVGMAVVSLAALVGAIVLLGALMSSGVGAVAILAGAAAMIVMAGAVWVLGKAIQEMAIGFQAMGQVGSIIENLVSMVPAIGALTLAFTGLAGSLALLGTAGLIALPGLIGLSVAAEGLGAVANILGIGGDTGAVEEGSLSEYQSKMLEKMDVLINEVKANKDIYLDREKVTNVVMKTSERKTENVFGLSVA